MLALLPFFMALHFSLWVVTCAGDDQPLDRQADGWTDRWAANPLSARKLLLLQLPSWTDSFFSASAGHSRGTEQKQPPFPSSVRCPCWVQDDAPPQGAD